MSNSTSSSSQTVSEEETVKEAIAALSDKVEQTDSNANEFATIGRLILMKNTESRRIALRDRKIRAAFKLLLEQKDLLQKIFDKDKKTKKAVEKKDSKESNDLAGWWSNLMAQASDNVFDRTLLENLEEGFRNPQQVFEQIMENGNASPKQLEEAVRGLTSQYKLYALKSKIAMVYLVRLHELLRNRFKEERMREIQAKERGGGNGLEAEWNQKWTLLMGSECLSPKTLLSYQRAVVLLDNFPRLYFTDLTIRQLSSKKIYTRFLQQVKSNDESESIGGTLYWQSFGKKHGSKTMNLKMENPFDPKKSKSLAIGSKRKKYTQAFDKEGYFEQKDKEGAIKAKKAKAVKEEKAKKEMEEGIKQLHDDIAAASENDYGVDVISDQLAALAVGAESDDGEEDGSKQKKSATPMQSSL